MATNLPLDLNLPSEQEMLDTVFDHFITKNNPPSFAIRDTGFIACLYRGPNDTKCAFGLFIPDNLYTPEMEGKEPRLIVKMHEANFSYFCQVLQNCHDQAVSQSRQINTIDSSEFKANILKNLTNLAQRRNLTLPA